MGSVQTLNATGDNDPEIEPQLYHRHHFYCDDCGSFELLRQHSPANHADLDRRRHLLARAARYASVFVLVALWEAAGLPPALGFAAFLAMGVVLRMVLLGLPRRGHAGDSYWRGLLWSLLPWVLLLVVAEGLTLTFAWPAILAAGLLILGALLLGRHLVGPETRVTALRCADCGATYPFRSGFFDRDSNPRGLTADDVPHPLQSPYHEDGPRLGPATPETHSRLPA